MMHLFNAGRRQDPDAIWRKIITEHPHVLDLMMPGNEAMLLRARQQHPGLNSAIENNGMPSSALLREIQYGHQSMDTTMWTTAATMPFRDAFALPLSQLQHFFSEGYIHVKNAVPLELIALAKRHINACLGNGDIERKHNMVGLPPNHAHSPPILNLFRGQGSQLPTIVQCLMGKGKVRPPQHAQIALRYPRPYISPEADSRQSTVNGKHWHVDGFENSHHSPFTILLGVCLSDVNAKGSGNFAVHPGSHWQLQDEVRQQVLSGSGEFSAIQEHQNKPDLGEPTQLLMKAGDCVIAHQKLPHLGMPNCSPDVRYQVYFRLHHVAHEELKDEWLNDLLLPFQPVKEAMEGKEGGGAGDGPPILF
jgi:hypothetical protein